MSSLQIWLFCFYFCLVHRECTVISWLLSNVCNSLLGLLQQFTGTVATVYWDCCNSLLGLLQQFTGTVATVYWDCCNSLLGLLQQFTGTVATVYWDCCNSLLGLLQQFTGTVATVYWDCCNSIRVTSNVSQRETNRLRIYLQMEGQKLCTAPSVTSQ